MKIIVDILDEEYMPECPYCESCVDINSITEIGIESTIVMCNNCFNFFEVTFIVREAKASKIK